MADTFERVMVIVAHPDDAESWVGGTVAKLATRPDSTALPQTQTIGMVLVACLAAMATWVDATAMMSTWSCTNSATTSR